MNQHNKHGSFALKSDHTNTAHPELIGGKIGVLLINLGTPDGTDYWSMRRYLAEFLTDQRVIEWSPFFWYPVLFGIVLNRRPQRVGRAYKSIWNNELDESFLRTYTRNQSKKLADRLLDLGANTIVDWAMRYGRPSIKMRLDALKSSGCERILIYPLYPQYAAATTASVNDKAFDALKTMRWQPAVRIVPPYYDDPKYISVLAHTIQTYIAGCDWDPEVVVASYHGIPKSYFMAGDPYHCQCLKTTRLLREYLDWPKERLITTFQSRFGPEEWLTPYTDETVKHLALNGIKRIAIINPGFVSDCLETLEEIAEEAKNDFIETGGQKFAHIPCLNDSDEGIDVIESIVRRELRGWTE
ncbi:MAG: ferrochelatase [Hyphomicrobiaceae bacterium]|nr:ferrochelatase [Hyphomicrobiaceae bacterium]